VLVPAAASPAAAGTYPPRRPARCGHMAAPPGRGRWKAAAATALLRCRAGGPGTPGRVVVCHESRLLHE